MIDTHLLDWIDFDELRIPQQTQASDTKDCVEDVDHVARAISNATMVGVLSRGSVFGSPKTQTTHT